MSKNFIVKAKFGSYHIGKHVSLLHPEMAKAMENPSDNDVNEYYLRKLEYLHHHGQLKDLNDLTFSPLTSADVEHQLANTPHVVFEVTDACNLKCTYCAYGDMYGDYDKRENKQLPLDKAFRLLDYLAKKWNSPLNESALRTVYISFYGGEPLLNIDFIKAIVNYLKQLNLSNRFFGFAMTTNGLLLDRYMDFLVENDFNLIISLDGDEANSAYRVDHGGNEAYHRIIKNVDLLRSKYPAHFKSKVNFNAVLHNKNSIDGIYHYFKTNYDKTPYIGELSSIGIKEESKELFMQTYRNAMESMIESERFQELEKDLFTRTGSYQSAIAFLHKRSGFVYKDYNQLIYEKQNVRYIPTGTCLPFSKKIFVTVNGKILPCERISQQFAIGKITEEEIIIDYAKIAEKYNSYYTSLARQCKHCQNANHCGQCIFTLKNFNEKNPICTNFMNNDALMRYTHTQLNFLADHRDDYLKIMEEVTLS